MKFRLWKLKPLLMMLLLPLAAMAISAASATVKIARLRYNGGGDWYVSPTALPNLIKFCNTALGTRIVPGEDVVEPGSREILNYPFVHMSGHGNVIFSSAEAENLRNYLESGGFLSINDSYGMDKFVRLEVKKIFPDRELVEIPWSHPVYHQKFNFPKGLPKIHEHDGKPAQGLGIFHEGRLVLFYAHESDIGDGWEDPDVHKDSPEKRQQALQMGANLVQYAFGY